MAEIPDEQGSKAMSVMRDHGMDNFQGNHLILGTEETSGDNIDRNQTPKFFAHSGVSHFKGPNHPGAEETGTTIALMTEATSATPKEDTEAIHRALGLINLRKDRYERMGRAVDLDKIIELEQQVVLLTSPGSPDMPSRLNNIGSSLETRFKRLGELADVEKAISLKSQAVSLTPKGDPDLPILLSNLGCSLESRFNRLGDIVDLNRAVECIGQAVLLTPQGDQDMSSQLGNLGCLVQSRFERQGKPEDLEKAIEYLTQAVSLTPQGHASMPIRLINLGGSLMSRFDRLGELKDLERAIEYTARAVSLTPEGHSNMHLRMNNLGCSYDKRYERLGALEDLDMAIKYKSQAALLAPQGLPSMPRLLSNLGVSLASRFERQGELSDLNKAIEYKHQAVSLTPRDHPDMPRLLSNLGLSFQKRFSRQGDLADIDKAIEHVGQAVSLTPQGHPDMPTRLLNLGGSLNSRFKRFGRLDDLVTAIHCLNEAVLLTPAGHPDLPRFLGSLASSLLSRFEKHEMLVDLDRAIEHQSQAVLLTPQGHVDMPRWLHNLGFSHRIRFKRLGEPFNLDKAIECASQAVSLTPQDSPNLPARLNGLGDSLESRFQHSKDFGDLEKAIEYKIQAVSLTPQDHLDMAQWLISLGSAYSVRFDISDSAEDIEKSLDCFQKGAETPVGRPSSKFKSALLWARTCVIHRPSSALMAYQRVMSLLPELAWLGGTVFNRYAHISDMGGIATEVAAVAIKMKEYSLALEWLEEGRLIIWKQMLQLRTPLDDLAIVDPVLAVELKRVAHDLDAASSPKPINEAAVPDFHSLEQAAKQHRYLAERWKQLVNRVRRTPGFENFLRPLKISELERAAQSGPVVVVNITQESCDALILRPGVSEILHVPLGLSFDKAVKARVQLNQQVQGRGLTERYVVISRRKGKDSFENPLSMLWHEVVRPVLVALDYLRPPSTDELPHITWCLTGPLSFLPIHAAGNYELETAAFNYVISSYTPTLSALLSPRPSAPFSGLLAVGQKATAGLPPLPGTDLELTRIQEKLQGHIVTRIDGTLATPAAVLAGMEEHSWVHLACHAMQNPMNGLESAFYLHDGTLKLAAITQKQLKRADIAFLSACQTATGDREHSDEAIHLAAGMLMAGYRTVIATLWSIGDADAPLIAQEVYGRLFEGGVPDARRAAVAVHKATERLRAKVGVKGFARWVPYIHIGQ